MENITKAYEQNKKDIYTLRNTNQIFSDATNSSQCDKKGIGFCKDNRFRSFELPISFDSWKGSYGNSQCSCVIIFSNVDNIKDLFVSYLNKNRDTIFKWMADELEKENEKIKEKAIVELKSKLYELENINTKHI